MQIITGKITRVEFLKLSYYGNPYHRVAIEDASGEVHILRTQIDSGINYEISNPEYRDQVHEFRLTRDGRIFGSKLVTS